MNIRRIFLPLIVLAVAAGFAGSSAAKGSADSFTPDMKLRAALSIINQYYLDDVDSQQLSEEAIVAMLKKLDPHSAYTNATETEELKTPLDGNFSGIGIQFQMLNDTIYVIQTIAGGPSETVGMLAGDRIIKADTTQLSGRKLTNSQIMSKLRGPKGTTVNVSVVRKGVEKPIDFLITRDDIPVNSVDAAYMVNENTGYIKLSRFGANTNDEVYKALADLYAQGMRKLIFDLEDNGGGYLGTAVELASYFLKKNDLIVYTESPRMGQMQRFENQENGLLQNLPLVLMVNQYSASASEILSGAIQDHDRGVIVGRRTFGKGLVQRPFDFPDGSMIRLTIARYHTPSGRSIQKPYELDHGDEYRSEIMQRYLAGEFTSQEGVTFPDSLKYTTLHNHRTVYGGGGISPDVFVPIDTTYYTDYYRDLLSKSAFNRATAEYIDTNKQQLAATYPDEASFLALYTPGDDLISAVVAIGEAEGVERNEEQLRQSMPMLTAILKGLVGRSLFDMTTYYKVVQPALNPVYQRAVEIISDKKTYNSLLSK